MHVCHSSPVTHTDPIAACRRGDRVELSRVFAKHQRPLQAAISRVVSPDDVDDVVQITLLTASNAFPSFRGDSEVRTWLIGIGIRVALRHRRRQTVRTTLERRFLSTSRQASPTPSAETRTLTAQLLTRLNMHLNQLKPATRDAFILHVFQGYTLAQVAACTNSNPLTVKSRIYVARRFIRERVRRDRGLSFLLEGGSAAP